jgi:L-lactate dehydrogenase complex protein LldG
MSARDDIFARIKANRPQGQFPLPQVPHFTLAQPGGLVTTFGKALAGMGGRVLVARDIGDLSAWVRTEFDPKVVCSTVEEVRGDRDLGQVREPRDLADVDVAIVRALLGVAESGSVLLTEAELRVNTLGYLAQHLVVLLSPAAIVPGLQDAYKNSIFLAARYAVFHTGPSATGDIEGVLIHGAQGVRSLTVILQA